VEPSIHLSDEQLELYALDRLADADEDRIEGHLLLCDPCRNRLDEIGAFAFGMRSALRQTPPHVCDEQSRSPWSWFPWRSWMMPALSLGCVAAILLVMVLVRQPGDSRNLAALATLTLTATRGSGTAEAVAVPSKEYDLLLADGGPDGTEVKVFDAAGTQVWNGKPLHSAAGALAKIPVSLANGLYLVRLEDAGGRTLHEYSFQVRP